MLNEKWRGRGNLLRRTQPISIGDRLPTKKDMACRTPEEDGASEEIAAERDAVSADLLAAVSEEQDTKELKTLPLSPKEKFPLVFALMEELAYLPEVETLVNSSETKEEFYSEVLNFIYDDGQNSESDLAKRYRAIFADPAQDEVLQAVLAFYWWGGEAGYQIFGRYPEAEMRKERGNMAMNFSAVSPETGEKVFCKIVATGNQLKGFPDSLAADAKREEYLEMTSNFIEENAVNLQTMSNREQKRVLTEVLAGLGVQGEHCTPTNKYLMYKDTLAGLEVRFEEGVLLEELLEQKINFSLEQKINLLIEILKGVHSLHMGMTKEEEEDLRNGLPLVFRRDPNVVYEYVVPPIVHRDLKPANIFVKTEDNEKIKVRIIDFGIAKIPGETNLDATKTGAVMGTLDYIPAWRFNKKSPARNSFAVDVWAVFEIGYRLLTGEHSHFRKMPDTLLNLPQNKNLTLQDINTRLHSGEIPMEEIHQATIIARVKGDPDLSALAEIKDADPELLSIFKKGLARKSEEAFETAEEAMQALGAWFKKKKRALPMQLGNLEGKGK